MSDLYSPVRSPTGQTEPGVVIIGAGPVGLLLANLLGQARVPTLLIEKRDNPLESSMAIGITPPSLEILNKLGLDAVFSREGVPVRFAEVHEAGRRLGRLDFNHIPSDYRFFLSIPQARTVEILQTNLRRFPTVTLKQGVEFTGLSQKAHGVQIQLRDVRGGTSLGLSAHFVVGCDGHRSRVRQAVGLTVAEKTYPQRFLMADFVDRSGLESEARLFFSAEGSVESFPLPGGWRRWVVGGTRETATMQSLIERVRRLTGIDLGREPARFVSPFGARRMLAERYYAGRILLAGDSAHVMSPIGGQGMNTGFADAEMLAAMLPGFLENPSRVVRSLAAYDQLRRRAFAVAARHAEQGMWLGTLSGHLSTGFRRMVIRYVLFGPALRSRLAPHFAMLTIPFRNLRHVPHHRLTLN